MMLFEARDLMVDVLPAAMTGRNLETCTMASPPTTEEEDIKKKKKIEDEPACDVPSCDASGLPPPPKAYATWQLASLDVLRQQLHAALAAPAAAPADTRHQPPA
jgi:hypothetical protein